MECENEMFTILYIHDNNEKALKCTLRRRAPPIESVGGVALSPGSPPASVHCSDDLCTRGQIRAWYAKSRDLGCILL